MQVAGRRRACNIRYTRGARSELNLLIKGTCPGFKDTLKNMSLKAETTCPI
jgi:hypothetical protein